ncbi:MAG: Rpn family recombination-promoting nuclease/putative transposase [Lachnospiraceae bacterium]|nr:Rpn family recombination-promoting nuclease/putative transposase [Lachnospiraceae bacterium]
MEIEKIPSGIADVLSVRAGNSANNEIGTGNQFFYLDMQDSEVLSRRRYPAFPVDKRREIYVEQQEKRENSKLYDSSSKLIFGNAQLCSQFLRNYMDMPILANVRAEDIEDVSERYVPLFTEERNADTVKRIKISEKDTLYFISLIEHKSQVDYNVSMQLLRYMVYIWEDYEKEMEKQHKGISKTKDFKYPPILPIVYYEGTGKWTAACNFKDRVLFEKAFEPFTPSFFYKLIQLNGYSVEELLDKKDELSLVMLINRLQSAEEFQALRLPEDYLQNLSEHSTEELLGIIEKVIAVVLRHLNVPEEEAAAFTGQVKERKMGELFEHFKGYDIQATRKEARAEGEELLLINLVCKKLVKGKAVAQIAEELEVEEERVAHICHAAIAFAPDYDAGKIREALHDANNEI